MNFKKDYDSIRKDVLYNLLIDFRILVKLVRLTKMCLNDTYSRVRVGKNLFNMFAIINGLKQEDASSLLTFNYALDYAIRMA
jgi:hypothetical protein